MFQDSSIYSHFLRVFRAFGYQKYQNRMFNYELFAQFAQKMAVSAHFSIIEQPLPYFTLLFPYYVMCYSYAIPMLSERLSSAYATPMLQLVTHDVAILKPYS